MKKLILIVFLLVFTCTLAVASVLMQEWIEGSNRYCKYSDGKIITVRFSEVCPRTN